MTGLFVEFTESTFMKKTQKVDLSHTIPSNPTDVWSKDGVFMYFFDKYKNVLLYQKDQQGAVQHMNLTPMEYINFTARLHSAGFVNTL